MSHQMMKAEEILQFVFAGHATFTLRSAKSGNRYTYRVSEAEQKPGQAPLYFVGLLTGSDNESSYTYLGIIRDGSFRTTAKSKMGEGALPVRAITWTLARLQCGVKPEGLEFYHEGRCGRCGRLLTVPESIEAGIGPDCATKMAA